MDPKSQPCPQKKIKGRVCASIWIITDPHPLTFHLSVSPSALVMPVINLPRPWADVVGPMLYDFVGSRLGSTYDGSLGRCWDLWMELNGCTCPSHRLNLFLTWTWENWNTSHHTLYIPLRVGTGAAICSISTKKSHLVRSLMEQSVMLTNVNC